MLKEASRKHWVIGASLKIASSDVHPFLFIPIYLFIYLFPSTGIQAFTSIILGVARLNLYVTLRVFP